MKHRKALVLGKFMPLHMGHLDLLDKAAAHAETVIAVVDNLLGQWPDNAVRAGWIRTERPAIEAVPLPSPMPQYPEETPVFWDLWTRALREAAPGADLIVSSEDYGPALAEKLGIDHLFHDPKRSARPFGARDLRADPFSAEARARMAPSSRRLHTFLVVLRGPEASGKSTFLEGLDRSGCSAVPEHPAALVAAGADPFDPDTLVGFAKAQTAAIAEALDGPSPIVVADSDAWSTWAWARELLGAGHPACEAIRAVAESAPTPDLILLFEPSLPWADGPHRQFDSAEQARLRRGRMAADFLASALDRGETAERVSILGEGAPTPEAALARGQKAFTARLARS